MTYIAKHVVFVVVLSWPFVATLALPCFVLTKRRQQLQKKMCPFIFCSADLFSWLLELHRDNCTFTFHQTCNAVADTQKKNKIGSEKICKPHETGKRKKYGKTEMKVPTQWRLYSPSFAASFSLEKVQSLCAIDIWKENGEQSPPEVVHTKHISLTKHVFLNTT